MIKVHIYFRVFEWELGILANQITTDYCNQKL